MAPKRKPVISQKQETLVLSSDDEDEDDQPQQVTKTNNEEQEAKKRKIAEEDEEDFDIDSEDEDDADEFGDEDEEGFGDDSIGKPVSLYVCRWPNGDFSLVSAYSKANAAEILDEISDPGHAIITPYNGPLFFDFTHKKPVFDNVAYVFSTKTAEFSKKERNSSLFKHFEELYKKKKDFDITIKFKDTSTGKEGSLPAHKMFLSIFCNYFKKYFDKSPKKNQIVLGSSLSITEAHVKSFLDLMYTNRCPEQSLIHFYKVAQIATIFECDAVIFSACNEMLNSIRFSYSAADMVSILNSIHESSSWNLLFRALCERVHKEVEQLRNGGLKSQICEILSNWKGSDNYIQWSEDKEALSHNHFKLSKSTYSPEDAYTMWKTLKETVFPLSHKLKKPEPFKKAFIQEINECQNQSEEALNQHPELAGLMNRADLTSIDVINSWMTFMGRPTL
ncbi:predicted protein [Naegleria gruberi]|uniref:Predicted protein n=1 Tax=Naegleria gruberi TaxID=5762 RepID=D2VYE2_NAEGR|nr:uncharacterized protein NAEGRDRAFT_53239 [Naegleria gruberi]EFC38226.1 predicted protein [Naegleria gruberi]|eukprot:XP_002670970.1 predicted protein [Naegleria gruberi strain NEG-M]